MQRGAGRLERRSENSVLAHIAQFTLDCRERRGEIARLSPHGSEECCLDRIEQHVSIDRRPEFDGLHVDVEDRGAAGCLERHHWFAERVGDSKLIAHGREPGPTRDGQIEHGHRGTPELRPAPERYRSGTLAGNER